MVWHATFAEAEIGLERDVIGEEITMYRENPSDHIGDLISGALWAPHPLGNPISGTLESIAKITRKKLLAFRDLHHFREDLVVAVAGPFTLEQVQSLLEPRLPATFHAACRALAFAKPAGPPLRVAEARDTEQLQLSLAWHTPGRQDPIRHALRLLSLMLGESASSRLFQELREERGLCYHISSDVTLFHETGAFEISAGLDPDARDEAIACIQREIADLVAKGPRAGELERAKRLAIAQSKLAFESTAAHAAWAGEGVMDFNKIPSPTQWRERIAAVSDAAIQQAAEMIFHDQEPACAEIGENP